VLGSLLKTDAAHFFRTTATHPGGTRSKPENNGDVSATYQHMASAHKLINKYLVAKLRSTLVPNAKISVSNMTFVRHDNFVKLYKNISLTQAFQT
jgi:hypothetical protein